jgi:hypothetical protein
MMPAGDTDRMRRPLALGLATLAGAGCGSSHAAPARHAASPCSARMAAAAGAGAHVRVVARDTDVVTCLYEAAGRTFRVTVDTAPQAWWRWQRAQVERQQTASLWSHTPSQQPRDVPGVGGGAFWVQAPRELVTSDGRRLLTVRVLRPVAAAQARRAAIPVARAGLGPVRIPVRTGP